MLRSRSSRQGVRGGDGRGSRAARASRPGALRALQGQARPAARDRRPHARGTGRRSRSRPGHAAVERGVAHHEQGWRRHRPPHVLLLDVIVVARRDPHVAQILRRAAETYLEAIDRERQGGRARHHRPRAAHRRTRTAFALLRFGTMVFGALEERPPSDEAGAASPTCDAVGRRQRRPRRSPGAAPALVARAGAASDASGPSKTPSSRPWSRTQPAAGRYGGGPVARAGPTTSQEKTAEPYRKGSTRKRTWSRRSWESTRRESAHPSRFLTARPRISTHVLRAMARSKDHIATFVA